MPDGVPAGHAGPWLHHVIGRLLKKGSLAPLRRLNGHLPVAAGGTEYVSRAGIGCSNCSTRKQKDGSIRKFHAMACTASCRREGPSCCHSAGIHHAPGWCRQAGLRAGGRRAVAGTGRPPGFRAEAGPSGDDLHCYRPVCEAIRASGGNFLPVCLPSSRVTLYEHVHGARMDSLRRTERAARPSASAGSTPGG